jgi:hypothetical protein
MSTPTLTEIVQFLIAKESAAIHRLKVDALVKDAEKVIAAMSPRHPSWRAYRSAQQRVSLLLTARRLLKLGTGTIPDLPALRLALRIGELSQHVHLGQRPRTLATKALRSLRKLDNRRLRAPERFAEVATWCAERAQLRLEEANRA